MTFPVAVTMRFLSMTVFGSPGSKDSSSTLTAVSSFGQNSSLGYPSFGGAISSSG